MAVCGRLPGQRDAEVRLTKSEADMLDDEWLDPDLGRITFGAYASAWIEGRPGLRPKTIRLHSYLPGSAVGFLSLCFSIAKIYRLYYFIGWYDLSDRALFTCCI
jgi:hypothetical protein